MSAIRAHWRVQPAFFSVSDLCTFAPIVISCVFDMVNSRWRSSNPVFARCAKSHISRIFGCAKAFAARVVVAEVGLCGTDIIEAKTSRRRSATTTYKIFQSFPGEGKCSRQCPLACNNRISAGACSSLRPMLTSDCAMPCCSPRLSACNFCSDTNDVAWICPSVRLILQRLAISPKWLTNVCSRGFKASSNSKFQQHEKNYVMGS